MLTEAPLTRRSVGPGDVTVEDVLPHPVGAKMLPNRVAVGAACTRVSCGNLRLKCRGEEEGNVIIIAPLRVSAISRVARFRPKIIGYRNSRYWPGRKYKALWSLAHGSA